jgi:hypothetical protein
MADTDDKAPTPIIRQTRVPIQLQQIFLKSNRGEVVEKSPSSGAASCFREWNSHSHCKKKEDKETLLTISVDTDESLSDEGSDNITRKKNNFLRKNKTARLRSQEPPSQLSQQTRKHLSRWATHYTPKSLPCRWEDKETLSISFDTDASLSDEGSDNITRKNNIFFGRNKTARLSSQEPPSQLSQQTRKYSSRWATHSTPKSLPCRWGSSSQTESGRIGEKLLELPSRW